MLHLALGALAAFDASAIRASVAAGGDHWAVLVAGSKTYGNYRHQADVCHAYQVVTAAGMKPENVIVLAYDDIANNPENPYPGQIFNKPTAVGTPGVDVYAGCKIDYSGASVTPATFEAVLKGNKAAVSGVGTGKVLESDTNSKVFINFVDHGGVGIVAFPSQTYHATELISTLTTMHTTGMYGELVFYLEACESGSMFQDLPENINIYATTASNAKESSWGTYCGADAKVNGKDIRSCLGDLYSVNWMEDSDVSMGTNWTLSEQFDKVVKLTDKSHVIDFGSKTIKGETIDAFQGVVAAGVDSGSTARKPSQDVDDTAGPAKSPTSSMKSADAELASAYARFMELDSEAAGLELIAGVQARLAAKKTFEKIAVAVAGTGFTEGKPLAGRVHMPCHKAAYAAYKAHCGDFSSQTMGHSATLAGLCASTNGDARAIVAAITEVCA